MQLQIIKEILRIDVVEHRKNNNFKVIELTTMIDETIIENNEKKQNLDNI